MKRTSILGAIALLASLGWGIGSAVAQTQVAGGINADTTWTAAEGPYEVTGQLSVRQGVTLTIEAGTEVQVNNGLQIQVEGSLVTQGAEGNPVVFRGAAANPGAWNRIQAVDGSTITLLHTVIRDATYGLYAQDVDAGLDLVDVLFVGYRTGGLYLDTVTGDHRWVRVSADGRGNGNTPSYGIYLETTQYAQTGGVISHNAVGINARNRPLSVSQVVFAENTNYGIQMYQGERANHRVTVTRCTFVDNGSAAIYAQRASSSVYELSVSINRSIFDGNTAVMRNGTSNYPFDLVGFSSNVFSENTIRTGGGTAPDVEGNLRYAPLLADPENGDYAPTDRSPARYYAPDDPAQTVGAVDFAGAPTGDGLYGFYYDNRVFEPETVYEVQGDIVVAPGVTVNFRPGAELRMAARSDVMNGGLNRQRIEIRVEGTLEADGTNSRPVVFTTDAAQPAPGDWYGIVIPAEAEAFNVAQVVAGYAYRGVSLYQNDHIVAGSRIHHSDNAGIYIEGGTPEIEEVIVEDGDAEGIHVDEDATVSITEAIVRRNGSQGIHIRRSTVTLTDSLVHDNENGIYSYNDLRGHERLTLNHTTVAHNTNYGINVIRASSSVYELTLSLQSSSITHNGRQGVLDGNSNYRTTFSCTGSNLWGNSPNLSGLSLPDSCFTYNPLYADLDNRNYEPTRWSPNRGLGVGGSHVGAIPYEDAIGPQIMGYLWEDFTFTRQGSPYTMLGDIVVPAGITVTVEPGTEIRYADREDGMGGGRVTNRAEFRFLDGATGIFGTPLEDVPDEGIAGQRVLIRSDAERPAAGAWYGLIFENSGTSTLYNVEVRHPTYGAHVTGPRAPRIRYTRVMHHNNTGLYFEDVDTAPTVDVHGAFVVGPRRGSGNGILLDNSDGQVTSSYVTHHDTGIRVHNTSGRRRPRVYLTNNTAVKQNYGVYYNRGSSSVYELDVRLYNNILADSQSYAVYDGNRNSYPTIDTHQNNNFYDQSRVFTSGTTSQNNINTDPNVEDIDWQDAPRWWDGQVWPTSLAIDAGADNALRLPDTDILGRPRNMGATVDIGAWEHDPDANVEPRADPVTDSIMVPRGEVFTFDGSDAFDPDGEIASAFWTMSDGTITPGLSVQHTFAVEGENQEGYLTIVDDDGAEDHARVLVNVNIRPIADAGPDVFQDEGPAESVFFDGTLSNDPDGNITSWTWDFGDGSPTTNQQSPRHSYLSAGLYTVTLTVRDNEGLTDTDTTIATVFGNIDVVGPLIEHNELPDGQALGQDITIRATVRDPAGVTSVFLQYRTIGDVQAQFLPMALVGGNIYEATIPADRVNAPGIEYWFLAQDGVEPEANISNAPANAPESVFDFLVVGDRDAPVIQHAPVANGQAPGEAVTVSATLTDATGIGAAVLFFRSQGSQVFGATNMARVAGDVWSGQIPAFVVGEAGVEYYISAQDASPLPNTAVSPAGAPGNLYRFTVQSADQQAPVIVHQPVANDQTAGQPVIVNAGVVDAEGVVASVTIVYRAVGAADYQRAPMQNINGNSWRGQIPGAAVAEGGIQYYIEAVDDSGNTATDPAEAPVVNHLFSVTADDAIGPTITHTPVPNGQAEGANVTIEATAEDPAGVASMRLTYQPSGFPIAQNVDLQLVDGVWTGAIPGFAVQAPSVTYYLRATDGEGNYGYSPAGAPAARHTFTVGSSDEAGPNLVHEPVADGRPIGQPVPLTVAAIDDAGVEEVIVWFRAVGDAEFTELALDRGQNSQWTGTLPGPALVEGSVEYYVTATDRSQNANTSRLPEADGEYFTFTVEAPDAEGPAIEHTPSDDPLAIGLPFVVNATVTDDSAISSVTLFWAIDDGLVRERAMVPGAGADTYVTTIAPDFIPAGTGEIRYFITASDALGNTTTVPAAGGDDPYTQPIEQLDVEAPLVEVALDGVADPVVAGTPVPLVVTAIDDRAVLGVDLDVMLDGDVILELVGAPAGDDTYAAIIPAGVVVEPGLTVIAYATDAAGNLGESDPLDFAVVPPPDLTAPAVTLARVPDGQLEGQAVSVTAEIIDAVGVESATLYYRAPGAPYASVAMQAVGGGLWRGTIPGAAVAGERVEYYVSAVDAAGNVGLDVDADADTPAGFTVSELDAVGPAVGHVPPQGPLSPIEQYELSIVADDPSGVAEVRVYLRSGGGDYALYDAELDGDRYTVTLLGLEPPAIEYYIEADDALGNTTRLPVAGDFRVAVVQPDDQPPTIVHAPPAEAVAGEGLAITATISDSSGIATAQLRYRTIGGPVFGAIPLVAGPDDSYSATIPAVSVNAPGVEYYFTATDGEGNAGRLPQGDEVFRVGVGGGDVEPPFVVHEPVEGPVPAGEGIDIEALADDENGVAGVTLYFRVQGVGDFLSVDLADLAGTWSGRIPAPVVAPPAIEYYLAATDGVGNRGFAPAGGPAAPYVVAVEGAAVDEEPPLVEVEQIDDGAPLGVAVTVSALILDDGVIAEATLYVRVTGTPDYVGLPMNADGDTYTGRIPAAFVQLPGIAYYVEARDAAGNVARDPVVGALSFTVVDPNVDETAPSIEHAEYEDRPLAGTAVPIDATVTDAGSGVDRVTLHFRTVGAGDFISVNMSDEGGDDYTATIFEFAVQSPGVQYYIEARDAAGNVAYAPAAGADSPYFFPVADPADETPPVIAHQPLEGPLAEGEPVRIEATVTDDEALDRVQLRYRSAGADAFVTVELDPVGGDRFALDLPGNVIETPGFEYHLRAVDDAGNLATHPEGAPDELHLVDVIAPDRDGPIIELGDVPEAVSAGTPIPITATVTDGSGVVSVRLHVYSEVTGNWNVAEMPLDGDDVYATVIAGGLVVEPDVLFVVEAEDGEGNVSFAPAEGRDAPYAVFVDAPREDDPPVIVHSPAANGEQDAPLPVSALVTDATGVAEVVVWYREAGSDEWLDRDLTADGDRWSGTIPAIATRGDAVEYYLTAVDTLDNAAADPAEAPEAWYTVALIGDEPDMGGEADMDPEGDMAVEGDMGVDDDMALEADMDPEGDMGGIIEIDMDIIPTQDMGEGGSGGDDDDPSGCACDVDDGGAPAPLFALLALLALVRPRRRR